MGKSRTNTEQVDLLTSQQARALTALMAERTIPEAAKAAGVKERTLHLWLEQPVFATAVLAAEGQILNETTRRLLKMQDAALTKIAELLDDGPPAVQLRTALSVLELGIKARELRTLESRLAALEAMGWYAEQ